VAGEGKRGGCAGGGEMGRGKGNCGAGRGWDGGRVEAGGGVREEMGSNERKESETKWGWQRRETKGRNKIGEGYGVRQGGEARGDGMVVCWGRKGERGRGSGDKEKWEGRDRK